MAWTCRAMVRASEAMREMFGVLILDKPEGFTSFDLVARARRRFGTRRIGHTGTLDPMATGVLPLCIGQATRIAQFLTCDDKVYEATLALGASTDTQDRTGRIVETAPVPSLTTGDLERALDRFRGEIAQVPPMFSAIRVNGERLHALARRGESIERPARRVTIHALDLLAHEGTCLRVRIACSKGTYVRTLAHDLGERLGCHAHLTALRRLRAGRFGLDGALSLEAMEALSDGALESKLIGEREALGDLPEVLLDAAMERCVRHGQKFSAAELQENAARPLPEQRAIRLTSRQSGRLLALAERRGGSMRYLRVLTE